MNYGIALLINNRSNPHNQVKGMQENEDNYNLLSDDALYEYIYYEHYKRLKVYALRLSNGNASDAEDLVQETFYRLWLHKMKLGKLKNLKGYLFTVLKNIWIDKWKEQLHAVSLEELQLDEEWQNCEPVAEPIIPEKLEDEENIAMIKAQFGELKPREKLLLELHLEGMSVKEIADKLDEDKRLTSWDLNKVKSKVYYRLKQRLKK
ncbi:MAG TPA: RNA polymerase sigma factor [Pyrinomonadaceae bacterium]|jgi:RNA polymerase sigma-70 factor (ECF subfamily)